MSVQVIGASGVTVDTDGYGDSLRVSVLPRAGGYSVSSATGTIAAALAANATVFAMRLDPASAVRAYIERVRFQWTTIAAFTAPVTVNRRLALYRGSGNATAGGTAIATVAKKHSVLGGSEFETAQGGDVRISTTGALTVTGITYETDAIRAASFVHVGAAGAHHEVIWEFNPAECAPVILEPGQLVALRNPTVMDAGGTWQLTVNVDWYETAAL